MHFLEPQFQNFPREAPGLLGMGPLLHVAVCMSFNQHCPLLTLSYSPSTSNFWENLDIVVCLLFQMVWEQGVVVIVNLTKLSDLGLVSTVCNIGKEIFKACACNQVILVYHLTLCENVV